MGKRGPEYRWAVLAVAFLGVFGALGFGRFGYSAVLPPMQKALDLNSAAAGSLASWNLAGYTIMAAVGGVLAARLGPRKVIAAGILVTALGMAVTGVAGSLASASTGRFITGLGNGVVLVPSVTLMAAWFERHQLGLASGIVSTGSSLALVVVGLAVPRVISAGGASGWRYAWYFFAGVTLVMAVLAAVLLQDRPRGAGRGSREIVLPKSAPFALRARMPRPSLELMRIFRSRFAWQMGVVYVFYGLAFLIYFTFFQKRLTADIGYTGSPCRRMSARCPRKCCRFSVPTHTSVSLLLAPDRHPEISPTFVNRSPNWVARRFIRLIPSASASRHAVWGERKCTCVSAVTQPFERVSKGRSISSRSSRCPRRIWSLWRRGLYSNPLIAST